MGDHSGEAFRCPVCGEGISTVWELPNPMLIHWLLNPGLVFNELFLGQRIPAKQYFCESCPGPKHERGYVRCASCRRFHPGMIWAKKRGFGNWIGYVCPDCGGKIPCLWNLFSLLILAVTTPLWALPYLAFRERWRASQQARAQAGRDEQGSGERKPVDWNRSGRIFGLLFWVFAAATLVIASKGTGRGVVAALMALPLCLAGGWLWGRIMAWFLERREVTITRAAPPIRSRISAPGLCPFCRTEAGEEEAVACTRCLSRHHEACWDEHGQCASCEGRTRFARVEESEGRPPRKARGAEKLKSQE